MIDDNGEFTSHVKRLCHVVQIIIQIVANIPIAIECYRKFFVGVLYVKLKNCKFWVDCL